MAYRHGVRISEVATSILPPAEVEAGIPMIVGTAPVGMAESAKVNVPVLCYSYEEAVKAFGYVPPKADSSGLKKFEYSISEFISSQFSLFGYAPVIIVNVLDPDTHKKSVSGTINLSSSTGSATIPVTGIIPSSLEIYAMQEGSDRVDYTDFTTDFDDDGNLVVTSKTEDGDFLIPTATDLLYAASATDPTLVTESDVIGGVSASGVRSGFELVDECFPRFRLVPGILLSPGFSEKPAVAAVMAAKASIINEHFKAVALIDVPTSTVTDYTAVAAWKNQNSVTDPQQIVCWPMLNLDGTAYHISTQLAALMAGVDADNDDVPYVSPSNHNFQCTGTVLADGTEVTLDSTNAAYLNSQGIVTALNFIGGWKCWGNRTACYPGNTDVKDAFISIRRMFGWIGNTLVQTFWQRVDMPLNRRQIETIVDTANIWLNGLTARQYILGGRVEFLDTENTTTDLMDGKAAFHVYITPPSPNREIEFVLEYDPDYIENLFS